VPTGFVATVRVDWGAITLGGVCRGEGYEFELAGTITILHGCSPTGGGAGLTVTTFKRR